MLTLFLFCALCLLYGSIVPINALQFHERFWLRFGLGLAMLPIIGVALGLLGLPISLPVYFLGGLSLVLIGWYRRKNREIRPAPDLIPAHPAIPVLLVISFLTTFLMYLNGAFSYSYMEDGDSWHYTTVAKMIAENGTFSTNYRYNHYSEPYTQGYQIVLGLLHQANDSIYWTVKFFNALFAALSIPFFYLLAREVFRSSPLSAWTALASTAMVFAVPSWLTHHIYSMTLNVTLLPLFFYAVLKMQKELCWSWIAGLLLGSIILNHFFTAFVTCLLYVVTLLLYVIYGKLRLKRHGIVIFTAALTALIFYIPSAVFRHGYYSRKPTLESHGGAEMLARWVSENEAILAVALLTVILLLIAGWILLRSDAGEWIRTNRVRLGTGVFFSLLGITLLVPQHKIVKVTGCCSREYSLGDFLFPQVYTLMHNPIGWGSVYTFLVIIGFAYGLYMMMAKRATFGLYATTCLFAVTFLMVQGMRLSFAMMTFRMWTFLTLFASLLAGYGFVMIVRSIYRWHKNAAYAFIPIGLAGVVYSSFAVKLEINTMVWPDHELLFDASHDFHARLRDQFEENTPVVSLCRDSGYLVSYDMLPPIMDQRITSPWRDEHAPVLYEKSHDLTAALIADEMNKVGVKYAIAGFSCMKDESERTRIVALVEKLRTSNQFKMVMTSESDILFEIVKSDD